MGVRGAPGAAGEQKWGEGLRGRTMGRARRRCVEAVFFFFFFFFGFRSFSAGDDFFSSRPP